MAIDYQALPVYEQKERILQTLAAHQVIVVQSPTGSGKTTQLPVILYEAGYTDTGIIAVTQPRRIAALSVSEFIAKQLHTTYPGLVGYKMRFEDKTDASTKIKIMTDGILLQELKLDPWLSRYSVVMVDEAHERSLNIDFVLGLLKRIARERKDFKIIISSATINAAIFSAYFDNCPIVTIDTVTYPVTLIYDPPVVPVSTVQEAAADALLTKIENIIGRVLANGDEGGILVFLPGEKIIKDCLFRLTHAHFARRLHIVPLYGRLPKEEQERVFDSPPHGKKKVVIATNIAETSITIADITTVIDSGLAKLNFYNPHTFTSSLIETPVSKASCDQRRGRAGRTAPGTCYRLYPRKEYDTRQQYTTEEIYRTDLSEVVLRMAELGITQFSEFDFVSPPGQEDIAGAIDTLMMVQALNRDHTLSDIGKLMVLFPLAPRTARIIVEAIMRYPSVIEEAITAAAFLSAHSPFILPPGEEMRARAAHHRYNDIQGDFVSYLHLFHDYDNAGNKERFCRVQYLDERVMAEIKNITVQLAEIVSSAHIPLGNGGSMNDYLCCIASGMIQFVCIREGRENFRSLTADHICIHPGSHMFRQDPLYIVAGEIVRTSRMFAMSVSPLTRSLLEQIQPGLEQSLSNRRQRHRTALTEKTERLKKDALHTPHITKETREPAGTAAALCIGSSKFAIKKIKGRKQAILPFNDFLAAITRPEEAERTFDDDLFGKIVFPNGYSLLAGEKLTLIAHLARSLTMTPIDAACWKHSNFTIHESAGLEQLVTALDTVLRVTVAKKQSKEYGFICLFTDGRGTYWFKVSRGFLTALNESLSSLEQLIDDEKLYCTDAHRKKINTLYRMLNSLYR
ncbi:MAG: ATP-dependent RNA helicase [Treponema sp.]|nr:ATP-dependent RNA helicase [Treponema sp.]